MNQKRILKILLKHRHVVFKISETIIYTDRIKLRMNTIYNPI